MGNDLLFLFVCLAFHSENISGVVGKVAFCCCLVPFCFLSKLWRESLLSSPYLSCPSPSSPRSILLMFSGEGRILVATKPFFTPLVWWHTEVKFIVSFFFFFKGMLFSVENEFCFVWNEFYRILFSLLKNVMR